MVRSLAISGRITCQSILYNKKYNQFRLKSGFRRKPLNNSWNIQNWFVKSIQILRVSHHTYLVFSSISLFSLNLTVSKPVYTGLVTLILKTVSPKGHYILKNAFVCKCSCVYLSETEFRSRYGKLILNQGSRGKLSNCNQYLKH